MTTSFVLGWIATILFTACYVPQLVKMVQTKHVEDISYLFFFIQFVANIIALVYAILIHQPPLIFKYVTGLLLSFLVLYYYFKYVQKKKPN